MNIFSVVAGTFDTGNFILLGSDIKGVAEPMIRDSEKEHLKAN